MRGQCKSTQVISVTKQVFSEHGIPTRIISDNGPQFSGEAYRTFIQQWQVDHITSSSAFLQLKDKYKQLKIYCRRQNKQNIALLCLWATLLSNKLPSPAEILNNHVARCNVTPKTPTPRFPNQDHIQQELQH